MGSVLLWGWCEDPRGWVKILVTSEGKLIIDPEVTADLEADVGDASASTLGSLYGILGNPAQSLSTRIGFEGAMSLASKLTKARAAFLDHSIADLITRTKGLDEIYDAFASIIPIIWIASDTLLNSNDAIVTHSTTTWTKKKETKISVGGTLRIKFATRYTEGYSGVARIYRNGVQVSGELPISTTDWYVHSVDLAGWSAGDLVQLYLWASVAGKDVQAKDFRLYGDGVTFLNTLE